MYQPRRVADPVESIAPIQYEDYATAAAANPGPRRGRQTVGGKVRAKVTPTAVAMAVTTGAAAFVVIPSFSQGDTATNAIPAEGRQTSFVSRDNDRSASEITTDEQSDSPSAEPSPAKAAAVVDSSDVASKSKAAEAKPVVKADWKSAFSELAGHQYAKSTVTVREKPKSGSKQVGNLKWGEKIQVTELVDNGYREVVYKKKIAYVLDAEISKTKPAELDDAGASGRMSPGKTSSKRVLGLTQQAMGVYNAVMSRWGGRIKSVGGYRSSSLSDHHYGRAIDFMLTPGKDSAMGWDMAKWLAANYKSLGVDHIIFEQKIWTPYRQTWRPMASRGSITANHYDHVHVSVER